MQGLSQDVQFSEFPDRTVATLLEFRERQYRQGFRVSLIPALIPRKDGGTVFEEGAAFSGIQQNGDAEACITCVAAPHIIPILGRNVLAAAAQKMLSETVQLPAELEHVEKVSPQLLVWWRTAGVQHEGRADMLRLGQLPIESRERHCEVIAAQVETATRIITDATTKPTIWGSWGFAPPDERVITGRGRGVPTNPHGHLHVIDFTTRPAATERDTNLSLVEKLNHYKPWASLLHQYFSAPLSRVIERSFTGSLESPAVASVHAFSEIFNDTVGEALTTYDGYELRLSEPVSLARCLNALSQTVLTLEELYIGISDEIANHHKYQDAEISGTERARNGIMGLARSVGFRKREAAQLASFSLGMRPTYGQINKWAEELTDQTPSSLDVARLRGLMRKYEIVRQYFSDHGGAHSLIGRMLEDTVADPRQGLPASSVWPEHATATYILSEYDLTIHGVEVSALRIIPGVDSTESAPQHITGNTLRRPTGG